MEVPQVRLPLTDDEIVRLKALKDDLDRRYLYEQVRDLVKDLVSQWPEDKPLPKECPYVPALRHLHFRHRDGRQFTDTDVELLVRDPWPEIPGRRPITRLVENYVKILYPGPREASHATPEGWNPVADADASAISSRVDMRSLHGFNAKHYEPTPEGTEYLVTVTRTQGDAYQLGPFLDFYRARRGVITHRDYESGGEWPTDYEAKGKGGVSFKIERAQWLPGYDERRAAHLAEQERLSRVSKVAEARRQEERFWNAGRDTVGSHARTLGAPGERNTRIIPQEVKIAVSVRDGGMCVQCHSRENLHFDHKIPWSRGGTNTVNNIQLLCERCNKRKGASDSGGR